MAGLRESVKGSETPPGLRTGTARKRCQLCKHYSGSRCRKYNYPVRANDVSDSFAAMPVKLRKKA